MNDEGFREIQLNGKQLVFLFMAATVVSVVIFLCGVLVGRGARPGTTVVAEMAGEIAADADSAAGADVAALSGSSAGSVSAESDASQSPDVLTYPERLQQAAPPQESANLAPAPPVQEPVPVQPPPSPAPAPAPPAVVAASSAAVAANPTGPGFAVQVAAYRDRREADSLAKQLVAKGYPAFVMDPVKGAASAMYRVRVGKYKSRKDAEEVSTRLENVEQFKPWIAR